MDTNTLPKELPPMETEIALEVVGALTKTNYKGNFKYRIPNVSRSSQISVMEARLNSGVGAELDPSMKLLHYMLAYLRYNIDTASAPKWWLESNYGAELYDPNVITELYQLCFHFEREWNEKVHGE